MKLFITGKTGQLGSALFSDSLKLNYEIIAPTRKKFNIIDSDVFLKILKEEKPDVVINTAAFNNVVQCETQLMTPLMINTVAVKNMAEIANELNIKFITISTDYVFDGSKSEPYIESDVPHPVNMYGISKLAGEYASLIYDNTTIIRTSALFGINSKYGNFIDKRIESSKRYEFVEISNDQTISPTYVEDLSQAILKLINHFPNKHRIYHLINEGQCTWYELTKEAFNTLNIDTKVIPVNRKGLDINTKMRRPLFSVLKNTKAKEIGIILPHWKDALRNYLKLKYKT